MYKSETVFEAGHSNLLKYFTISGDEIVHFLLGVAGVVPATRSAADVILIIKDVTRWGGAATIIKLGIGGGRRME